MPPEMMEGLFGGLIAAGSGLTALFMILRYKLRSKAQISDEQVDRVMESQEMILQALEDLREEVAGQQSEVKELSGRIEFAERLLAKSGDEPAN